MHRKRLAQEDPKRARNERGGKKEGGLQGRRKAERSFMAPGESDSMQTTRQAARALGVEAGWGKRYPDDASRRLILLSANIFAADQSTRHFVGIFDILDTFAVQTQSQQAAA
jgi:hypothetical protein